VRLGLVGNPERQKTEGDEREFMEREEKENTSATGMAKGFLPFPEQTRKTRHRNHWLELKSRDS
jgi:hypothetical protein